MSNLYFIKVYDRTEKTRDTQGYPEYPYLAMFVYNKRYWGNRFEYDTEYLASFRQIRAWCYTNLGEGNYQSKEGKGRHHLIFLKNKDQCLLLKLALA